MTTAQGKQAAGGAGDAFARDYDAVRADDAIQYAPIPPQVDEPRDPPPEWLVAIQEFLGDIVSGIGDMFGAAWPVMKYVLIALAAVAIILLLIQIFDLRPRRRRRDDDDGEPAWGPERGDALALLEDADRLAAEGRYGAATHLLLQRSVGHISNARPEWLDPSSTAREIARLPDLPDAARTAFAAIAERVERSLFALRNLNVEDWQIARAAYAEFALQRFDRKMSA